MKLPCTILVCILFSLTSFAQSTTKTISGVVKDVQNEALPGATVTLLKSTDTTFKQRKVAANQGKFKFERLEDGIYLLKITSVGNIAYNSGSLQVDEAHLVISLPAIILLPEKKSQLKEVVVTAKKPLIEQDIDKTIVNVDAMISASTSNALEVLEKSPGVMVDINGNISLNGAGGVLVLIDGRQTYMSGQELANYLKSLPGGLLDKIELITNPPAKYDASGSAIINIRLKKNKRQGYFGNFVTSVSKGRVWRAGDFLTINYQQRRVNFFGNIGYSKLGNYTNERTDRRIFDPSGDIISSQQNENDGTYRSHSIYAKGGMDYTLTKKTTVGFNINIYTQPGHQYSDYFNNSFMANNIPDSVARGVSQSHFTGFQREGNLNFQHKFNEQGKELSGDFNVFKYSSSNRQFLPSSIYAGDGTFARSYEYLYKLPSDKLIYNAKFDYSLPLKNKLRFDAGTKTSFVNNDNVADYFNILGGAAIPDLTKSNHFVYDENINATYVNMRKDWRRVGVQAGLRFENTNIKGNQAGNSQIPGTLFRRSYSGLYPTLFVSYKLDSLGKNNLSFNFAKRLNRPNYQQLNPFLFYRDRYSYTSGNPLLKPATYYQAELVYSYKQLLRVSFQYNRQLNNIYDATSANDDIFILRPENLGKRQMVAVIIFLNIKPAKWWTLGFNIGGARFAASGEVDSQKVDLKSYGSRIQFNNQFQFKKGWSAELVGNYTSRQIYSQGIMDPLGRVNIAVQKKILKNKGSIKFTYEDIGHLGIIKQSIVSIKQAEGNFRLRQDSERVGVALTYSFGKETFSRKRRHDDNAAGDVKDRAQ